MSFPKYCWVRGESKSNGVAWWMVVAESTLRKLAGEREGEGGRKGEREGGRVGGRERRQERA